MNDYNEWKSLGIEEGFARKLIDLGLRRPTITQFIAIPRILKTDRDLLLAAPTGTGKTEAVLIPLLQRCVGAKPIAILYVTPLRALNRDICSRIGRLASVLGFSVDLWHGDTPSSRRRRISSDPPHILVTTPESLQVVLVNRELRKHLRNCLFVVIDEAQELYTSERGLELVVALNRLDLLANRHIIRVAISAPIGDPRDIASFFFYPRNYEIVDVRRAKEYDIIVDTTSPKKPVSSFIDALYAVPKLVEIINGYSHGQILVFVNTRVAAEELGYLLRKFFDNVGVHHGSLSREVRESVELSLKRGDLKIAIATSSLELGIDIGGVDLVIQVMSPRQVARLIQRVGRAGHREGLVSRGIVLTPPMILELLEAGVIARRTANYEFENLPTYRSSIDVALHQLIGLALEWKKVKPEHVYKVLVNTLPFSSLSESDVRKLIQLAQSLRFIQVTEDGYISATKRGELYYRTTTMIVDTAKFRVRDVAMMKTVATLDEEFVVTCREGDVIVLGGKLWRISSIDESSREVLVEPVTRTETARLPKWVGENIPVSIDVAEEVCRTIERLCSCSDESHIDAILENIRLGEDAKELVKEALKELCRVHIGIESIAVEVSTSKTFPYLAIYSCLGTKGSETLALLLSALIERIFGYRTSYKPHQICTLIALPRPLDKHEIKKLFNELKRLDVEKAIDIVKNFVTSTPLFDWFVVKVAKKMGLIAHTTSLGEAKRALPGLREIELVREEALRELSVEKLDFEALRRFLERLKNRSTKVRVYVVDEPSKLVKEIASMTPISPNVPPIPRTSLTQIVLKKLANVVRLHCLSCGYQWITNLRLTLEKLSGNLTLDSLRAQEVKCPKCQSKAITYVRDDDEAKRLRHVLRKLEAHGFAGLSESDSHLLDRHRKIASLIMDYGVLALLLLQATGIGPESAKRILAKASNLEELVDLVIRYQRNYLLTRRFWSR